MTTLDALIGKFGIPSYCKIDVEGFELEVVKGLTAAIPLVSLEFTREGLEATAEALSLLGRRSPIRVTYLLGDSMQFAAPWANWESAISGLRQVRDQLLWGDIFISSGVH